MPVSPPDSDPTPAPITQSKVLLVEGRTPLHFFDAILKHLGLRDHIEIHDFGSVNNLRNALRALAISSGFRTQVKSLGVVRDAESDAKTARQSVDDALAAAELAQGVETSVFILPDNNRPGMIETLCLDSVRDEPVFACVEDFFECAKNHGIDPSSSPQAPKSYAQAFLALQDKIEPYPGRAAYHGYWPWDSPVFDELKEFLRAL
jgi:hypothetical protein